MATVWKIARMPINPIATPTRISMSDKPRCECATTDERAFKWNLR